MEEATNAEKFAKASETLAKIETTLGKLYEKSANSTSFGDQSITLASIKELEASRNIYRLEMEAIKRVDAATRKTLKIYFR